MCRRLVVKIGRVKIGFLAVPLVLLGCKKGFGTLSEVKIWSNQQFVRTIDDPRTLEALRQAFNSRTLAAGSADLAWTYRIDIATANDSISWIYDPRGFVQVLAHHRTKVYRFKRPETVRAMLLPPGDEP